MAEEPESKSDAQVPVHLNRKQRRALMREQELLQAQAVPQRPGEQEVPQLHEGTGMGDKTAPHFVAVASLRTMVVRSALFDVALALSLGLGSPWR